MICNLNNLTKSFLLRKGLALCFVSCLVVCSASANAQEFTTDPVAVQLAIKQAIYELYMEGYWPEYGSQGWDDPTTSYSAVRIFGSPPELGGTGYDAGVVMHDIWFSLRNAVFTNDLGQVVNGLDVLTNQLSHVSERTDWISEDASLIRDLLGENVLYLNNTYHLTSGQVDGQNVYVQNYDDFIAAIERGQTQSITDALNQSDVLNGTTSFKETGPSYTNSQDTIEARYKYGGQSISNAVGTLGGFDSLDGLLEPLAGVSQSVEIEDLDELDLPEGDSVITLWTDLTILGTEIDDCTIDVGEVLDADLRSILRSMLSVVYSIGCGFLLFRRGLREYKYYASLGSTEGVAE